MKAHELLSDKSKWCRRRLAVDNCDRSVAPQSALACRWCLWGALLAVYEGDVDSYRKTFARVSDAIEARTGGNRSIDYFNDAEHRTFEEVRQVLIEVDV